MAAKIQTEFGNILIDNEVIARVAGLAAIECYGVVGMASTNVKDGIVQLLLGDSLTKGIRVDVDEAGSVTLELHVIVEYGTKISAIADNLISTVRYRVSDMLGVEVSNVDILVEGVRVDKSEK
jgi:uncharacterized alkaline shock family protein YloU